MKEVLMILKRGPEVVRISKHKTVKAARKSKEKFEQTYGCYLHAEIKEIK